MLKLEFWHFGPWTKNLGFLFSHRYLRYFLQKKARIWHTALSNNMLASSFRIVFFGVFCVCRISIVFLQCLGHLSTFLHMPASTCSSLSFLCAVIFLNLLVLFGGAVRSWEVWEVFFLFVFFIFLCCLVVWCGAVVGGGWGGVGGGADDVHANATCFFFLFSSSSCAVWWCGAVVGGGWGGWGGG